MPVARIAPFVCFGNRPALVDRVPRNSRQDAATPACSQRRSTLLSLSVGLILAVSFSSGTFMVAQQATALLTGTIKDASGAVVAVAD